MINNLFDNINIVIINNKKDINLNIIKFKLEIFKSAIFLSSSYFFLNLIK